MVLNQVVSDGIRNDALDTFDDVDHMGFSDDNATEPASSTVLTGEFLRKTLNAVDKDTVAFTYEWDGLLGLSEANGETLQKFGMYTDLAGNTLQLSKLLPIAVAKTADKEVNVGYKLTVEVVDQTE